ncbi:MAG: hypothetical protein HYZ29_10400, partial [Myxococcales bacterium]|nr:hypothetical protein [Myxococcales bacterium]
MTLISGLRAAAVGGSALALLGLASCGDSEGSSAGAGYDVVGTTGEELTKKCGVDKYQGPQGADVSSWQGDFDWTKAGVTYGYARISDGANYIDKWFEANWKEMKALGILRGAYQYFEPGQDATAQANLMVQKVGGKLGPGDLPCMIDVEATGGQSPATIAAKIKTWIKIVEAGTGKKPIIYTGAYFWQDHVKDTSFGSYPLWIAAYGPSCPSIPDGWTNWTFWQYCDGQTQYCSNGKGFDRDVFNGTAAELKALAGGSVEPVYAASFVDQSFPLAVTALQMKAGETIDAHITLKNTGTKAWDAKTRLGTTEPRDRVSAFADASWLAPNRPAGVTGSVPPGGSFKFQFKLHAPSKPGVYAEYFGVLQEGVTWFSDQGQGGPPDNQLQAKIEVVAADDAGAGGAAGAAGGGGAAGAAGAAGG